MKHPCTEQCRTHVHKCGHSQALCPPLLTPRPPPQDHRRYQIHTIHWGSRSGNGELCSCGGEGGAGVVGPQNTLQWGPLAVHNADHCTPFVKCQKTRNITSPHTNLGIARACLQTVPTWCHEPSKGGWVCHLLVAVQRTLGVFGRGVSLGCGRPMLWRCSVCCLRNISLSFRLC